MNETVNTTQLSVNQQLKSEYDNQYQQHDAYWRTLGAKYKVDNLIALCGKHTFDKVLEVGSGDGSILEAINKLNFAKELHALDISKSGISRLQERNLNLLKSAQVFDGYSIPFADKSFDLVILSHVLEHVEFERSLLREIQRVSRYQLIEVPRDYRFDADKKLAHFLAYGHINLYTPSGLRFLLLSENYRIIEDRNTIIQQDVLKYLYKDAPFYKKSIKKIEFLIKNILFSLGNRRIKEYFAQAYTIFCESKNQ